jgi:transcription elongation factor GreB
MSRAFVKESNEDQSAGELPERPIPAHANYVTPRGLVLLQTRASELVVQHEQLKAVSADDSEAKQKIREVEHDQRYFTAQIDRAQLVDLGRQPCDEVHFGATVRIADEHRKAHEFSIVGDDEADVAEGRISWASPLACALLGARAGDRVTWRRPARDVDVEIIAIQYSGD